MFLLTKKMHYKRVFCLQLSLKKNKRNLPTDSISPTGSPNVESVDRDVIEYSVDRWIFEWSQE